MTTEVLWCGMEESKRQSPFQTLGRQLKFLRENQRESLAEVSGAIEIETEALERIEKGEERPSEDILMLLINHFGMQDHEAVQLWESAGYERDMSDKMQPFVDPQARTAMILLALDARILYSDGIAVNSNQKGVVLNFTQISTQPSQSFPVARVGMSYEQAEEVLRVLQQTILRHKYVPHIPLLPPGDSSAS